MPTYEFVDTITGDVFEEIMSISDMEQYVKDNPNIKRHYSTVPGLVRSSGTTNVDNHGFKEVLQKVGEAHPFGSVANEHVRLSTKEAKTRDIVKKHAKKQAKAKEK